MRIELAIKKLAGYIEEFNGTLLVNNEEVPTSSFGITVPTPTGLASVNNFIKKCDLPMIMMEFNNGYVLRVAQHHILQQNGNDIFAKELLVGSTVDHYDGKVTVTKITHTENENCYDIAIDAPHLYYDANGLIHHNTIITATLAKVCEKYGRTITIVPNKSLVEQTEEDFINCELDVGVYYGDRKDLNKTHTICTWQSLNILDKKSKDDDAVLTLAEFLDGVSTVVVDECFDGTSQVLTPTGYVPIKDIKSGDLVINYSEVTQKFKVDTVVTQHINLTKSSNERMYEMQFDSGVSIQVTGNHKFLTNEGWIRADMLTENHEIVSANINTYN